METFSPPAVAKLWGVSPDTVLAWIRSGDLRAFDVAKPGGRPRYRVEPQALEAFKASRTAQKPAPRAKPGRRKHEPGVIEFY